MAKKNNFLLVDLNEKKTKKLAETITSNTSRKILNYLAEKEHDTEAQISKGLGIPISTVHYHLQKLQQAQLVNVDEYHYSPKGREVNHYKLANKYIIIAPKKVSGLREKLKGILPVGIIAVGISAVLKFATMFTTKASLAATASFDEELMVERVVDNAAPEMAQLTQKMEPALSGCYSLHPDIALWFLIGSLSAILIYIIVLLIKEWRKK
tara:strand:+ start:927 stop:1556 length:630 start_codon:yes stop_codon:yes gene_type:complete